MIGVVIAAFLLVLAVVLAVLRRKRNQTITYAVGAIAVSSLLNVDPLYVWVDAQFGGRNIVDLAANWTLMGGAFFLARGVTQADRLAGKVVRLVLGPQALIMSLGVMTLAFLYIDAPATSTTFMADFGSQPAAAVYSIAQYAYLGSVMLAMLRASLDRARAGSRSNSDERNPRRSAWVLTTGSAVAVLLCLNVIAMDIANVARAEGPLRALQHLYDPLHFLSYVLVGAALLAPPIQRWSLGNRHRRGTRTHVAVLMEAWKRTPEGMASAEDPVADDEFLRQMIFDVRDLTVRSGGRDAPLEVALLAAERHLRRAPKEPTGKQIWNVQRPKTS